MSGLGTPGIRRSTTPPSGTRLARPRFAAPGPLDSETVCADAPPRSAQRPACATSVPPRYGSAALAGRRLCVLLLQPKLQDHPRDVRSWCRLLVEVPGQRAVAAAAHDRHRAHLRREAQERGVSPDASCSLRGNHCLGMGGCTLADLALDTFPYTSHAPSADACGRACRSRAATPSPAGWRGAIPLARPGLPELVTRTPEDYSPPRAGNSQRPDRLAETKSRLAANRMSRRCSTARGSRTISNASINACGHYRAGTRQPIVSEADDGGNSRASIRQTTVTRSTPVSRPESTIRRATNSARSKSNIKSTGQCGCAAGMHRVLRTRATCTPRCELNCGRWPSPVATPRRKLQRALGELYLQLEDYPACATDARVGMPHFAEDPSFAASLTGPASKPASPCSAEAHFNRANQLDEAPSVTRRRDPVTQGARD